MPLLIDPAREWKSAAFSQFNRNPRVTPDGVRYMGVSMVTDRYHYIEWRDWNHIPGVAGDLVAVELYHQRVDAAENTNLADSERNKKLISELSHKLKRGWQGAVAPN